MDPTACLNLIYDADSPEEKAEHAQDLLDWLRAGGFMPRARDGGQLLLSRSQLQRYCRAVVKHPRWRKATQTTITPSDPEGSSCPPPTWDETCFWTAAMASPRKR
jgi:hypothetical protein